MARYVPLRMPFRMFTMMWQGSTLNFSFLKHSVFIADRTAWSIFSGKPTRAQIWKNTIAMHVKMISGQKMSSLLNLSVYLKSSIMNLWYTTVLWCTSCFHGIAGPKANDTIWAVVTMRLIGGSRISCGVRERISAYTWPSSSPSKSQTNAVPSSVLVIMAGPSGSDTTLMSHTFDVWIIWILGCSRPGQMRRLAGPSGSKTSLPGATASVFHKSTVSPFTWTAKVVETPDWSTSITEPPFSYTQTGSRDLWEGSSLASAMPSSL
mmetsp:Transcript_28437/g.85792  ORF Transcript_28437/g.85792 Transcript_28437/m.85792 type:complete len:264 (-) Transcript_28437:604-1395(-)